MRIAAYIFAALTLLALSAGGGGAAETFAGADSAVELAKDEIAGDNQPTGDYAHAGVTFEAPVTSTLTGTGNLTLTLAGDVECDPHWAAPLDPYPSRLGDIQTSVVTVPSASGAVISSYSVTCPAGGPFSINITSYLQPTAGEDVTNNLDENWVQIVVSCDADTDGLCSPADNCPAVATAWTVPAADSDCDGFSGTAAPGSRGLESLNGTDANDACPDGPGDAAWPPDVDNSGQVALSDIVMFGPSLNQVGQGYNPRFDLNASGLVTTGDMVAMGPFFNKSCTA